MNYNSIITIDDDICIDAMIYDVLDNEIVIPKYAHKDRLGRPINETIISALKDEDKYLLETYAPKLFNTMIEPKKLLEVMIGLVRIINRC